MAFFAAPFEIQKEGPFFIGKAHGGYFLFKTSETDNLHAMKKIFLLLVLLLLPFAFILAQDKTEDKGVKQAIKEVKLTSRKVAQETKKVAKSTSRAIRKETPKVKRQVKKSSKAIKKELKD